MKKIVSVLFAGAGAVGAMVAYQCEKRKDCAVSILASGERLERYTRDGFTVNGSPHRFKLTDAATASNPDLIIIACKYYHLDAVLRDIKNHVGPDTLILSLLNGINSEEIISAAYGAGRVPRAFIIGTDAFREQNRIDFSQCGTIVFGDDINSASNLSARVRLIADFFSSCDVRYEVPENMVYRQWFKFMLNVGLNQLSGITRISYRPFQAKNGVTVCPPLRALMADTMREVIAVSGAEGTGLTEADINAVFATIDGLNSDAYTSMYQDIVARRTTEIDLFAPVVSALGKKHGIPTPINDALHKLIKVIEFSYEGKCAEPTAK